MLYLRPVKAAEKRLALQDGLAKVPEVLGERSCLCSVERCRGQLRVGLAHVFGSEKAGLGILVAVLLRATILCGLILSDDLRQAAVVVRGSLQLIRLVLPPATRQEVKVPVNGRMAII